ncbi:DotU family type IV/VI secretion system protein [Exilibacterium tricleocarpae]|uniref:DotU family type IV/VI secretion system protein n=1 Tax=Exilibacterium tricleocarpae TaxID=2591008 RepID=A0A545SPJ9_9GAMM|nr:type IVB secretion system protein IcmH/DotU [Exilibacterium tricleocarpae]TQV66908.1 DotU family type IV/VI secretion system protein [Exilibacterium tricleocarpae]
MTNSKDSDKTVFSPPPAAAGGDRTVMVPTPGARRPAPSQQPTAAAAQPAPQPSVPPSLASEPIQLRHGLNPLVTLASTLVLLATRLRTTVQHDDVPNLHRQVAHEIREFDQQAKNAGIAPEIVLSASYLLCSVIDEMVLNTPWGANSGWSQRSLLSLYHRETGGGEKCFTILQRMLEAPAQQLDFLELFYLCLSIGFEGQYRLDPRGQAQLAQIQDHLYQTIENYRGGFEPDLSGTWPSSATRSNRLIHYIPMWVVASCVLALLLLVYSGFRVWLYQSTAETAATITELRTGDGEQPPAADR